MNRLFFYLLLLLSVLLHSCLTDIDRELDVKPKLVLHCYLIPQMDTIILILTNSAPLFAKPTIKIEKIPNAIVELSTDNKEWVKMEYDSFWEVYMLTQAKFPIIEGKTYYLRASSTGFETVFSSCTVPVLRETHFDYVVEEHSGCVHDGEIYLEPHLHTYFRWIDYVGEDNYYILCKKYNLITNKWDNEGGHIKDTSAFFSWDYYRDDNYKQCIFSDEGNDGRRMSVLIGNVWEHDNNVILIQVDKHCYKFESSLANYDSDMQFFMLEPIQLYSNIKNGYGVFGAFVMREYPIIIDN